MEAEGFSPSAMLRMRADEQTVTCVVWCCFVIIGEITKQSNFRYAWRDERAYALLPKEQNNATIPGLPT